MRFVIAASVLLTVSAANAQNRGPIEVDPGTVVQDSAPPSRDYVKPGATAEETERQKAFCRTAARQKSVEDEETAENAFTSARISAQGYSECMIASGWSLP